MEKKTRADFPEQAAKVSPHVLILGIGNLLWADEGFGVRAVEALDARYAFPENVKLMDGGTQGIYLVHHIRKADILVIFDAIDRGLPPGAIALAEGDDVPKFLGAKKMSLHQTGFQEVLAMAEMMDDLPRHILLIGVQPVELEDYGGSLRDEVKRQIEPAIAAALRYLATHGIEGRPRREPRVGDAAIGPTELALEAYEEQRPSQDQACRYADLRVLACAGRADQR